MDTIRRLKNQERFVKFLAVGVFCLLVQVMLFRSIVSVAGINGQGAEIVANFLAFTISALINFYLHATITWRHAHQRLSRTLFMAFAQATVIAVVINQFVFVAINLFIPSLIATAVSVVITTYAKWLMFDREVFGGQPQCRRDYSSRVTVVMPAYNEEKNIATVVHHAQAYLDDHAQDYRIVVVNDASTDRTGEILDLLAVQSPRILVHHNPHNLRYGKTVSKGLELALLTPMDWVFFTDSDGQFDLTEIGKLLDTAGHSCADLVVGYRKFRADPLIRRINGLGWTLFCCCIFQFWVKDVDCAFKLIHRQVLEHIGPLQGSGATINPELLHKARQQKFHWEQVAVSHFPRREGVATGANRAVILDSFRSALRLRFTRVS